MTGITEQHNFIWMVIIEVVFFFVTGFTSALVNNSKSIRKSSRNTVGLVLKGMFFCRISFVIDRWASISLDVFPFAIFAHGIRLNHRFTRMSRTIFIVKLGFVRREKTPTGNHGVFRGLIILGGGDSLVFLAVSFNWFWTLAF